MGLGQGSALQELGIMSERQGRLDDSENTSDMPYPLSRRPGHQQGLRTPSLNLEHLGVEK